MGISNGWTGKILSDAEIEQMRPQIKAFPEQRSVGDLLATIDAMRAALEAWIWWDTKLADGEETALDYDKAVELTKRAGIEWIEWQGEKA